jgi:predicted O-methyltransferase YrrM
MFRRFKRTLRGARAGWRGDYPAAPAAPVDDGWPAGHFYSPIPSLEEISARDEALFGEAPETIAGVDLNLAVQEDIFRRLAAAYPRIPFTPQPSEGLRFFYENPNFSYGEVAVLFGMIEIAQPRRIIEIGSGYSSCAFADINDILLGGRAELTFIEPYPELLNSLIAPNPPAHYRILASPVQDVDLSVFDALEAGDILFVDSSHVSKTGSDVNHIYFEILPRLRPGVYVHIHDIGYPFEYPREWVYQGRAWNEAYLVRAFLQFNKAFEIQFYNGYWARRRYDELIEAMPLLVHTQGSSLWLKRTS